jgi:hypothetical protein
MREKIEMSARLEGRGFRVKFAIGILACGMATSLVRAETFAGCSWAGPDLDWALDMTLPTVDLAGSLGSEVIDLLLDAGVPISFISGTTEDPDVSFQRSEPTTVRELLGWVMAQTPGYRLEVVNGKFVIYPQDYRFDEFVRIGDSREARRAMALFPVLRELRSKSPVLHSLGLPTLKPWAGIYRDSISVGGGRTVVEHLVSLVAGSHSATFVIRAWANSPMEVGLMWADVIEDLLLVAPKKVEVGAEFQVVPRIILADGTPVTLIGLGCGVDFKSIDESVLTVDRGRAIAITKGTAGIQAKYEAKSAYVEIEVVPQSEAVERKDAEEILR